MPQTFNYIRKSSKFRRSRGLLASGAGRKYSGVARVHRALGQETHLRPRQQKTTEFEVKNRCKGEEEAKQHLL